MAVKCAPCNRTFGSKGALEQHVQDAPAHAHSFDCTPCNRSFGSERALEQHSRDSPAHATSFKCTHGGGAFGSDEALEQHLRDRPAHAPSIHCVLCNRSFNSEEALQQHLRDSPAHARSFKCNPCDRSFGGGDALQQHLRDSPAHQRTAVTPLDAFFRSFPTFDYDPLLPPATSYACLRGNQAWQRGDAASNDAWNRYQEALEAELQMWSGAEDDLTAWHVLCRAIGVDPLPETCARCEEV
jgi:hypothetical protein